MKHFVIGSLLALSLLFNAANAEEKDLRNTFAVVWNFVSADLRAKTDCRISTVSSWLPMVDDSRRQQRGKIK